MACDLKIFWTVEAVNNLGDILDYLNNRWSERETNIFKKRLSKLISLIEQNPNLFPISHFYFRLRKAVLSRQTTVFYEVSGQIIYIVYLFNNMQDVGRIE
jgi:hypothetical protein